MCTQELLGTKKYFIWLMEYVSDAPGCGVLLVPHNCTEVPHKDTKNVKSTSVGHSCENTHTDRIRAIV